MRHVHECTDVSPSAISERLASCPSLLPLDHSRTGIEVRGPFTQAEAGTQHKYPINLCGVQFGVPGDQIVINCGNTAVTQSARPFFSVVLFFAARVSQWTSGATSLQCFTILPVITKDEAHLCQVPRCKCDNLYTWSNIRTNFSCPCFFALSDLQPAQTPPIRTRKLRASRFAGHLLDHPGDIT